MTTAQSDQALYQLDSEAVLKELNSSMAGLSMSQVEERLKTNGLNQLTQKKKLSAWSMYIEQFKNTLTLILIAAAGLILFIYLFGGHDQSDLIEAALILSIVFLITFMGFIQEFKAEKSIESLKKLLAYKAKVRRDNHEQEIDVSQLVPGDIVILEEGTKVPADLRLLEVYSLTINEASLTGESSPASKKSQPLTGQLQINDQKNMAFSGTAVSSGRAVAVVVATGDKTEIGKIAGYINDTPEESTPIQKRLDTIGKMLGYIILGICAVVFVFIMFFASEYVSLPIFQRVIHSFIAAVALAVAAIPEGLPAVVTISLALGTQRMLKQNALVRKLNSVETLGSVDVICSDKTGTLTKGEMTVRQMYINNQLYTVTGTGYETVGEFQLDGKTVNSDSLKQLLEIGLACNNADVINNGILGDPTEGALIVAAKKAQLESKFNRLLEIPFSSERKMMSVVVEKDNKYWLYTKGAVEIVLTKASKLSLSGKESELSKQSIDQILEQTHQMSTQALRTLGFGYREISKAELDGAKEDPTKLENNLVFVGIQGMIDPPRVEVAELVKQCHQSGIKVVMITGDHIDTAKAVANEIGIVGEALTGEQLDKLSDEELIKKAEQVVIYARVNPAFKMKIVNALKQNGHIVAMTGDGVNDAPALKKADIGIAMGITGTDVAKEASDMVLMDDHFSTIVKAIQEGRGIFQNIRKFVNYLLSCNIGEVFLVFFAVILFKELPLSATMLLWVNVVTDGLPAIALGLDPAGKDIMKQSPKQFQTDIVSKRMWLDMVIFGILMTVVVLFIYWINLPAGVEEAKAAAFTTLVVLEMVRLFLIRSEFKTKFWSNHWLLLAVIGTIVLQVVLIYVPWIAQLFEIRHFDSINWLYISVGSILMWIVFKAVEGLLNEFRILTDSKDSPNPVITSKGFH